MELIYPEFYEGTSLANPATYDAYREMIVPAGPTWAEEHLRRLQNAGIQPHFQLVGMHALETLDRMVRKGVYKGPLNLTCIGIGGGHHGPHPYNLFDFIQRAPDGCTVTAESLFKNVLPWNTMALAMGMHVRCGIEDTLIDQHGKRFTSVQQVQQLVRIAKELGREIADGKEAREIYRIGTWYDDVDETLAGNGMTPNRKPGVKNVPLRRVA